MTKRKGTRAEGWAVISPDGQLDVYTVSPTRRAAIINWLVRERRIMIYQHDSDEKIEALWKTLSPTVDGDFELVEVWIDVHRKAAAGDG